MVQASGIRYYLFALFLLDGGQLGGRIIIIIIYHSVACARARNIIDKFLLV
jgi:hypothetical protein